VAQVRLIRITQVGDEVTTSKHVSLTGSRLIASIEAYLRGYVNLVRDCGYLPVALWLAGTHTFESFDAYGPLVITSATKRSGKTRLLELISFVAANARMFTDPTSAALYTSIDAKRPTLLLDEVESFSSARSPVRPLLNTGYRRGQTIPRRQGAAVIRYHVYCPKAFALIGDVYDTLRDRSIVIETVRARPERRFLFTTAQEEGGELCERLRTVLANRADDIRSAYADFAGLPFLGERDEEIWTPLFVLCRVLCPERVPELVRAAADLCGAKSAPRRKYSDLSTMEDQVEDAEYGERLVADMLTVLGDRQAITTSDAIKALRNLPNAPWRTFRGDGLKAGIEGAMLMSSLLARFGLRPKTIRTRPSSQGQKGSTAKDMVAKILFAPPRMPGCECGLRQFWFS
jgi:Protein of unknown function (DUF3631)